MARYRVRVGPSIHEYIDSYRQATCLLWSDSEKAAADNGDRPGYIIFFVVVSLYNLVHRLSDADYK